MSADINTIYIGTRVRKYESRKLRQRICVCVCVCAYACIFLQCTARKSRETRERENWGERVRPFVEEIATPLATNARANETGMERCDNLQFNRMKKKHYTPVFVSLSSVRLTFHQRQREQDCVL